MKIAVVSGKGGTGKTTVSAALADLCDGPLILADCDVDAANFALVFPAKDIKTIPHSGRDIASVDEKLCIGCGDCEEVCRFSAIHVKEWTAEVDLLGCEGCATCTLVCPVDALKLIKITSGEIFMGTTEKGPLVWARLLPGSGNSGRMVHEVKRRALTTELKAPAIIDGPPGIGCPLIATVGGMDAILMVTEPGISAVHDLKRLVQVCKGMHLRMFTVINRFDLSPELEQEIEVFCKAEGIPIVGKIPFDKSVVTAVSACMPVTRIECPATDALRLMKDTLFSQL
ncbi:MAG TPA: ATP-binding protein [Methanocorpusculum sp.]|nr:ATP-binding protein [Methanocorpusculum sp.]HJJ53349.1 ATP-binding protein [Methanocorpusculum sp.]